MVDLPDSGLRRAFARARNVMANVLAIEGDVHRAAARSLSLEVYGPHRMTATAQASGA